MCVFQLHKKFKFVLHIISIMFFTRSTNLNYSFLFVKTAKSEMCAIASLSDLRMVDSTIHRLRYTDFLILLGNISKFRYKS